jgi:hypothetical protein
MMDDMDAAAPTHERSRELAALRRRAYGPDADIQRDPEALRRLHELEELARPADPGDATDVDVLVPAIPDVDGSAEPGDAASGPEDSGESSSTATGKPADRWRSRRLWAVAAICLAVGLALGAGAVAIPATFATGRPDFTLQPDPGLDAGGIEWADNLEYWGVVQDSAVRYENYDNIQVLIGENADGGRCLILAFRDRAFTGTCAPADLDPVLDVYAGEWPVFLEDPLNPGGVVRFVARPDAVDVWFRPGTLDLSAFDG